MEILSFFQSFHFGPWMDCLTFSSCLASCTSILLSAEDLPVFALQDDRVVEVVGEPVGVHKAVEMIASHLKKFLVDRSIIPIFEMNVSIQITVVKNLSHVYLEMQLILIFFQMQMANNTHHVEHMPVPPPHQSWGPPQGFPPNAGGGPGFGATQFMPPPRQVDNYYPPAEMPLPLDKQPHHGISAYGRDASIGVHTSSNTQSAPSMVTQVLFLFHTICFLVIPKRTS